MNTQALKKCLVELDKETPNLFYIKGILETVVDANEIVTTGYAQSYVPNVGANTSNMAFTTTSNNELSDEEREIQEYTDRYNNGPIAELR